MVKYHQKILYVDDDPISGTILQTQLQDAGFECDYVRSAYQAVEACQQVFYDFVLTEFHMPDMTGIELMLWLQKHKPQTRIIIISGIDNEDIIKLSMDSGAVRFLNKPVKIAQLKSIILKTARSFSGKIKQIGLIDLLQILCMDPSQKRLIEIQDQKSKALVFLYIKKGSLIHADYRHQDQHLSGKEAFLHALKFKNGKFQEVYWQEPQEQTISQRLQELAMETNQIIDESEPAELEITKFVIHNILVVDDDALTCAILSKILRLQGYSVTIAETAIEAIKLLERQTFNLIFTDLNLPLISGIELFAWVKSSYRPCPVILISTNDDHELKQLAHEQGFLRFMSKPVDLKELTHYLSEISEVGLQGFLENIGLLDFIQINLFAGDRKCIEIRDTENLVSAWIFIESGRLVHAEYGEQKGQEAFDKIVAIERGNFFERPWIEPKEQSLAQTSSHKLLMLASQTAYAVKRQVEISEEVIKSIEQKIQSHFQKSYSFSPFMDECAVV